ncbi:dephospho-CoA kinase [Lactobacillus terrae]|uniref:dephospho-CoA kinase n=1 Tax=Lactobacillus terrae TaxID=2269374 RepID=UPI000C1B6D31|nr:dephospho-CoA kinase [Lactobacillus terrae]
MSLIYGLTGGIATGKSTVAKILQENNIEVFSADQVARDVVKPGTLGLKQIVETFGTEILNEDQSLNRKELGSIVFKNKTELDKLNKINGPLIRTEILNIINNVKKKKDDKIYVFEIPLLFEFNYQQYLDGTICLSMPKELQTKRLMDRDKISEELAQQKISSQMPIEEKVTLADYVFENTGTIDDLTKETNNLIKKLRGHINNELS